MLDAGLVVEVEPLVPGLELPLLQDAATTESAAKAVATTTSRVLPRILASSLLQLYFNSRTPGWSAPASRCSWGVGSTIHCREAATCALSKGPGRNVLVRYRCAILRRTPAFETACSRRQTSRCWRAVFAMQRQP